MRVKYKSKYVDLDRCPSTFTTLCSIVRTYFKVLDPILIIRDDTGFYQVSSSAEFNKIHHRNIHEIQIKDAVDSIAHQLSLVNFNKMDSIDTCTSHEKTDSEDESKRSELAKSEEIYSDRGVSACVGFSCILAEASTQTDPITAKEIKIGRDQCKARDFSTQYDCQLKFDVCELEEIVKNEIIYIKHCIKEQIGICHKEFKCSNCLMSPIIGARFECTSCKMSFCERCEEKIQHPHDMFKHKHQNKTTTEATNRNDLVIKRVLSLGLGDISTIESIANNKGYNFNKIVETLLFQG